MTKLELIKVRQNVCLLILKGQFKGHFWAFTDVVLLLSWPGKITMTQLLTTKCTAVVFIIDLIHWNTEEKTKRE